jgi:acetate kinase
MKPANPRILTINGGSSSIKFALFEAGDSLQRIPRRYEAQGVRAAEAVALFCYQVKKWMIAKTVCRVLGLTMKSK